MFAQGWAVHSEELGSMQSNGLTGMISVPQKNVIQVASWDQGSCEGGKLSHFPQYGTS